MLTMANLDPRPPQNNRLWAHLILVMITQFSYVLISDGTQVYVFTGVVCYFYWKDWQAFTKWRVQMRMLDTLPNRSIMVTGIPIKHKANYVREEERLENYFKQMFPDKVEAAVIGVSADKIRSRMVDFNKALLKLEKVEWENKERAVHSSGMSSEGTGSSRRARRKKARGRR